MPALSAQPRQTLRGELTASAFGSAPSSPLTPALVLRVNGKQRSIPLSTTPAACGDLRAAAELVHAAGGLEAKRRRSSALALRVGLDGCAEALRVQRRISALAGDLLQLSMDASEDAGTPACCIPRIRVHDRGAARVDVDVHVESGGARGQAFLETAARAVLPLLERLGECQSAAALQIFSTPVDQVSVDCRVGIDDLIETVMRAAGAHDGSAAAPARLDEHVRRLCSGSHQPELAARHNDHVLASISAAFERDFDAGRFVLEARAHASRWGSCEPLANWRQRGRELIGQLQLPLLFDGRDIAERTAHRSAQTTIRRRAPSEPLPGDALVDIASVALAASLGFLQQELLAQLRPRRPRTLLPPPLPAHGRLHQQAAGAADERRFESGVRPAFRGNVTDRH